MAYVPGFVKKAISPEPVLLAKLGSIVVHCQEMLSDDGHAFDRVALTGLLDDHDVKDWLAAMDEVSLLPKKRNSP